MIIEILNIKKFKELLEKYRNGVSLEKKIKYFFYSDLNTTYSSQLHIEHLRFIVAYNKKDILGICLFAYWDGTGEYAVSYISTNEDYRNIGVSKIIVKNLFDYFNKNYFNLVLGFSGYSISGWKYLRKYIVKYSQEFNVKIKEQPIEYITEWSEENRKLLDESRKIIN